MKQTSAKRCSTSVYPLRPPGSKVIVKFNENDLTTFDRLVVYGTSLFFVGGIFWVPALYAWAWKRYHSIPKHEKKRKALYLAFIVAGSTFVAVGPHRNRKVGEWIDIHRWRIWKSWLRFFAFEIVADCGLDSFKDLIERQAIVAVSPHGIFPFGLAMAVISETSAKAFGKFRIVVASATQMIPWVRDILRWIHAL
jgi:hypothetical protein